jgi:2-polyprenyl-6-methoxyphenol hydroxylase-like FAD-dependent oxidoreductase
MAQDVDVLIVGAGPTGLALALWLTRLGVKVRIVDKSPHRADTSRALVTHARTLELYDQIGIAEEVVARGRKFEGVRMWAKGAQRARADLGDMGAGISPFPFALMFPQDEHELLLIEHLKAAGVSVERPVELRDFRQGEGGVTARLASPGAGEERAQARFLAGCDGAHSTVRTTIAAGFPGGEYSRMFYVADVVASGPVMNGDLNLALDAGDFLAVFPMKGEGRARLVGDIEHTGGDTLTFDDVGHQAIERLGVRIEQVNWFSSYRVHHRVAATWRSGSAFLLGDAAHIHSPVGGQGMNTGIGDAINLAWKLAAVIKGGAAEALLDTYQSERIAFARRLVATTDRAFQAVSRDDPGARFARLTLAPAMLPLMLRLPAFRRLMFRTVSQTGIDYRGKGLAKGSAGGVAGGDRLPWVEGGDNFAPLRTLGWHVQVHGAPEVGIVEACADAGLELARFDWTEAAGRAGFKEGAFHLVRPDGYVALVAEHGAAGALSAFQARFNLNFREPVRQAP